MLKFHKSITHWSNGYNSNYPILFSVSFLFNFSLPHSRLLHFPPFFSFLLFFFFFFSFFLVSLLFFSRSCFHFENGSTNESCFQLFQIIYTWPLTREWSMLVKYPHVSKEWSWHVEKWWSRQLTIAFEITHVWLFFFSKWCMTKLVNLYMIKINYSTLFNEKITCNYIFCKSTWWLYK